MCEVQCGYQVGAKFWEVHSWLKSLRLHKYSDLFSRMTYDQMMSLTEEQLEAQGVTKGARHKIILNINKLKNRVNNLKALIQSLDEEGCNFIRQALNELKTILNTPIKPYVNSLGSTASPDSSPRCDCEDNIENSPSYQCDCFGSSSDAHELLINHIIKVIEKIGSLFIYTQYVDDECLKMFNVCIDKCLSHEAFSGPHKQRLCFWKQQTDSLRYSFPGRRSMGHRQLKGKWGNPKQPNEFNSGYSMNNNQSNYLNGNISSSATGFLHCNKSALNASNSNVNNSRRTRPMGQTNLTQPNFRFICNYNHSLGFPGMERNMNSSFINQGFNEHLKYIPSNLSNDGLVLNNIPGSPINRSSQINNSGQLMNNVLSGKESDSINTYIEKLCLRMTEQALGGGMDEDMDF